MIKTNRILAVLILASFVIGSAASGQVTIDADNPLTITPSTLPSGTVTFDSGKLTVSGGETTLPNAVIIGGTNEIASSSRLILTGPITGDGSITKTGGEQLHFFGDASDFSGKVTISSSWINFRTPLGASPKATYELGTSGTGFVFSTTSDGTNVFPMGMITSTNSGAVIRVSTGMPKDATLQVGGEAMTGTYTGSFSDDGGKKINLEKVGSGTWTISKAQSFSGTTTLKEGTLAIQNSYTSPITVEAGTLQLGNTAGNATISKITLQGGTVSSTASMKAVTISQLNFAGGKISGSNFVLGGVDFAAGTSSTIQLTGTINVTGPITGSGTVTYEANNSANNQLHFSGSANTEGKVFSGTIIANKGGYVAFRTPDSTSASATYKSTNGGNFVFLATGDTATFKFGELTSTGNCEVRTLNANTCPNITLEVGGRNTNAEFNGLIKDNPNSSANKPSEGIKEQIALTKVGTGTWTITANQDFTGPTNVNGGTLTINGNYKSSVDVNNGGTLAGSGNFQDGVEVKINEGGTLKRSMGQAVILNGGTYTGTDFALQGVEVADGVTSYATPSGKLYIRGSLSGAGTLSTNGHGSIGNQLWLEGDNTAFEGTIISDNKSYVGLKNGASTSALAKYVVTNAATDPSLIANCGGFCFISEATDSGIFELGELSGNGEFRAAAANQNTNITLKVGNATPAGENATFSGWIYGNRPSDPAVTLSVVKEGAGSWTLTGRDTFSGTTTVSAGKLIIGSTGEVTATQAVTVEDGAELVVNGTLTSTGGITLANGSTLSGMGRINAPITLTGSASYALDLNDSTIRESVLNGEILELVGDITGPLTLDLIGSEETMQEVEEALGGDPVMFDVLKILTSEALITSLNNMASGNYSLVTTPIAGGYMLSIMGASEGGAVPEPSAWLLLLMGVLGSAAAFRPKGKRA
ncbi:MAG: autotransporter-associated beta strand repeat-containing protein [Thermoguttaceae bacterium]|nr:autotransporter-associated beta strand repeat-containing protein [Thermoguttaceae bacterium]